MIGRREGEKEKFGFLGGPSDGLSASAFLRDLFSTPEMSLGFSPLLLFFKVVKISDAFTFQKQNTTKI